MAKLWKKKGEERALKRTVSCALPSELASSPIHSIRDAHIIVELVKKSN